MYGKVAEYKDRKREMDDRIHSKDISILATRHSLLHRAAINVWKT
jgi:hypothetical protein